MNMNGDAHEKLGHTKAGGLAWTCQNRGAQKWGVRDEIT
jgi:hypothetical protein